MVDKISVEIALEGGAEVEQQLASIGKTGQKTFSDIQIAAEQLDFSAIADGFQTVGDSGEQAFDKVQTAVKSAAVFEQIIQGIDRVNAAFEALGAGVLRLGARLLRSLGPLGAFARAFGPAGIAVGVVAGAFIKFGNDAANAINKLTGASAKLDLSVQNLDKLQKALKGAGISSDAILPGLEKFKQTLGESFFKTDVIAGLQKFIAELEGMPDGAERTTLAMQKLGDALGAEVIAGLQTGAISAQNFAAALSSTTPATQQQIVDAAKYRQTLNLLKNAYNEFTASIAVPLTPVFQFLTEELQRLQSGFNDTKAAYQSFKAMLQEDFSLPWLLKLINFDPNLMLSKWRPFLELIQSVLGTGTWPALDELVLKAQAAEQALQKTGQAAQQVGQQAAQGFLSAGEAAARAAQQSGQAAQQGAAGWNTLASSMQMATASANEFAAALVPFSGDIGFGVAGMGRSVVGGSGESFSDIGHASGGLLGGRGTGTSDSNLAWVSRGEHIMPAGAVRQPGVLAFLEALRRSGGNLSRVLDNMTHFAIGGLVPRPAMAFAGGGFAGGGNNVTIQFPGLPAIGGLRASSEVVDELRKAAALAQVRSGGRKPSRYS